MRIIKEIASVILVLLPFVFFSQDTLKKVNLATVVISTESIIESGKQVSLLNSEVKENSSSVADVLEKNSTVYIKKYGKGQLSSISIRGTGASQTQIYWNGFKINSPTLGQTDLSLLPLFFINEAKINYGSASILDGSGGLGGSVQLNNKLNWKKGVHFTIGKEFASFTNSESTYGISYGNKTIFNQLNVFSLKGLNNFTFYDLSKKNKPLVEQINNKVNQQGIQYEFAAKLSGRDMLTSTFTYFKSERQLPPIIGGITNKEIQKDNNFRSFISWKAFLNKYESDLKVSFFKEKMNYIDSISFIFSEIKVNTYQANYKLNFKPFKKGIIDVVLLESFSEVNSNGFDSKKSRNEAAIYAKFKHMIIGKFNYEVFVRQELIDNSISPFTGGIGFNYNLLKKKKETSLDLKGNVSKNYRTPTLNDLYWNPGGNMDLLPENGWSGEMGINSKFKKVELSFTGFYGEINNWIQWLPSDKGYWSPKNLKSVINKGFETNVLYKNSKVKIPFLIHLNYAFTQSKNNKTFDKTNASFGKTLIYVPKHKVSANINLKFKGFTFNYNQIYNSKVYIDETNTIYLPHYFPANISLAKSIVFKKTKLRFQFQINNLYNEPYQIVANRPIPGINYEFKIKLIR